MILGTADNCRDTYKTPEHCPIWARHQQCIVNPGFMLRFCAKSCRACTAGMFSLYVRKRGAKAIRKKNNDKIYNIKKA